MTYSKKKVGGKQTLKVGNSSDNNELVEGDLLGVFSQKPFQTKLVTPLIVQAILTTTTLLLAMNIVPHMVLPPTNVLWIQLPKYHDNDDLASHIWQLTKVWMTNGENIEDHKLQYFPIFLKRRVAYWFSKYETMHL